MPPQSFYSDFSLPVPSPSSSAFLPSSPHSQLSVAPGRSCMLLPRPGWPFSVPGLYIAQLCLRLCAEHFKTLSPSPNPFHFNTPIGTISTKLPVRGEIPQQSGWDRRRKSVQSWDLTAGASLPICCLEHFSLGPISCYLSIGEEEEQTVPRGV